MATTIGALRVELSANIAKFEAAMGKAAKNMARTQRKFAKFGSQASAAGRSLSVGLTAPLVAVGALAAKSFLSFEQGMNKVAAVSGATEAEMAELTAIAKDLGATTSFSAAQAAEGLGFLAQAGFDATEAGRALPGVLQLAAAGGIELAAAADIATNVLAGYGLEVDQLARVNDVLAKASISTNTNVQQMGEAFKFAGVVASSAGISFEEAGAAMALMGNAGIQAEMAGTSLQQAIFRLVEPTDKAAGVMEDLGIHATDAHGRLLPLDQIVEQLEPRFKNTAAMATIFGSRAIKGMGALVAEGSDKLRALTTELEHAGGTAQEVADKKLAGLRGAWTRLQSAAEGVLIEIGDRLSPVLERLAAFLTDRVLPAVRGALEVFDRLSPGMQTSVIAVTALTAAIGPLLIALGGVTATLTAVATGVRRAREDQSRGGGARRRQDGTGGSGHHGDHDLGRHSGTPHARGRRGRRGRARFHALGHDSGDPGTRRESGRHHDGQTGGGPRGAGAHEQDVSAREHPTPARAESGDRGTRSPGRRAGSHPGVVGETESRMGS